MITTADVIMFDVQFWLERAYERHFFQTTADCSSHDSVCCCFDESHFKHIVRWLLENNFQRKNIIINNYKQYYACQQPLYSIVMIAMAKKQNNSIDANILQKWFATHLIFWNLISYLVYIYHCDRSSNRITTW